MNIFNDSFYAFDLDTQIYKNTNYYSLLFKF
jgi:hypothetical protein